jgi:two-component system OmpR family response regulator
MLFEEVWGYHYDPQTNVIDVHIGRLRRKLEEGALSQLIHTVRGSGYVLRRSE